MRQETSARTSPTAAAQDLEHEDLARADDVDRTAKALRDRRPERRSGDEVGSGELEPDDAATVPSFERERRSELSPASVHALAVCFRTAIRTCRSHPSLHLSHLAAPQNTGPTRTGPSLDCDPTDADVKLNSNA